MNLTEFQQFVADTYGEKDSKRGIAGTFMYFMEEVGELAEAIREPDQQILRVNLPRAVSLGLQALAHL